MNTCLKFPCSMNMTSGRCYDEYCPNRFNPTPTYQPAPPMGCICPPTSEKTCENPICPRKGLRASGTMALTQTKGQGK